MEGPSSWTGRSFKMLMRSNKISRNVPSKVVQCRWQSSVLDVVLKEGTWSQDSVVNAAQSSRSPKLYQLNQSASASDFGFWRRVMCVYVCVCVCESLRWLCIEDGRKGMGFGDDIGTGRLVPHTISMLSCSNVSIRVHTLDIILTVLVPVLHQSRPTA